MRVSRRIPEWGNTRYFPQAYAHEPHHRWRRYLAGSECATDREWKRAIRMDPWVDIEQVPLYEAALMVNTPAPFISQKTAKPAQSQSWTSKYQLMRR